MARAIVPSNRNSGIPYPELDHPPVDPFADIDDIPFDLPRTSELVDDLHALAAELADDEGLGPIEARSHALALQDHLHVYAVIWDVDTVLAGNPTAVCAFAAPDSVPVVVPQPQFVAV